MNLLTVPLLRADTGDGPEKLSLPGLLTALGEDKILGLTGIQRHQEDAFHVFLCSIATAILARKGDNEPRQDECYWHDGLLELAGDAGYDAWALVTNNLDRPAFMQPPLPEADHSKLKHHADTPDALDLLPTAKNHELKQNRAVHHQVDEWIYALISLQTMSGFFGRGNPGIARMNSGFGNRPIVEVIHGTGLGIRWRDAITRLLIHRQNVLQQEWGYRPDGLVLIWLEEWNGKRSLLLSELDPNHIEIARRIRLKADDAIQAHAVPSDQPRISSKELKGVVGDAWLPIDVVNERKALTVSPGGLTADLLRRLAFRDQLELSPLQSPLEGRNNCWLSVSVLVRGQGTTEGYHERWIQIPPKIQPRLFSTQIANSPLADLARNAIATAGQIQSRILKPAIFTFLEGAPEEISWDRDTIDVWWKKYSDHYNRNWSDAYFPWLWDIPEDFDIDEQLDKWRQRLRKYALNVLTVALDEMPSHSSRRWRTRIEAERVYHGAFFSQFPHLKESRHEPAIST